MNSRISTYGLMALEREMSIPYTLQPGYRVTAFTFTWISRYQNVSILDFIGANDDGGGAGEEGHSGLLRNLVHAVPKGSSLEDHRGRDPAET